MKDHTQNEPIDLEPNSKPYLLKRIISDCFDVVVIFLLFMIVLVGILNTPIARIYNEHIDHCKEIQEQKKDEFGSDTEAINTALQNDEYYQEEKFAANLHGYLLKLLAGFIAEAMVLLVVPFISRKRATPGKLLMNIMPFCEKKHSRASNLSVIGRFVYIFIIDSAFFYPFTGIFVFLIIPVIRLIEMLVNKKNKTICDVLTGVMIIEQLSYQGIK